jgi:hypothetical protein
LVVFLFCKLRMQVSILLQLSHSLS